MKNLSLYEFWPWKYKFYIWKTLANWITKVAVFLKSEKSLSTREVTQKTFTFVNDVACLLSPTVSRTYFMKTVRLPRQLLFVHDAEQWTVFREYTVHIVQYRSYVFSIQCQNIYFLYIISNFIFNLILQINFF